MKRCPECRRDYFDDSLLYCLDDGSGLVEGPASPDEPATAIFPATPVPATTPIAERVTDQALKRRRTKLAVVGLSLLALALVAYGSYYYLSGGANDRVRSIAVLPFMNDSGSTDLEYLADGLPETLIYRLSQLPDLVVAPRSSAFRFKGKQVDVNAIGAELGADAVLTGNVAQRGENLIINVELVDVRTKRLIWGDQFDRRVSDLLTTQREIASKVTEGLRVRMTGSAAKAASKQYTTNSEAYQLYLKGRYHWNKREASELRAAIQDFQNAINADSNFGLAYTGLADAYSVLAIYDSTASAIASMPLAKDAASRAIAIDDSLAEAHASRGIILDIFDWNTTEAEKEYKRAIEINSSYVPAHQWYGEMLCNLGRFDEGMAEAQKAVELEPFYLPGNFAYGINLYKARRYDEAIRQLQRVEELSPEYTDLNAFKYEIYAATGNYDSAVDAFIKQATKEGESPQQMQELRRAFETAGWPGFLRERIKRVEMGTAPNAFNGAATIYAYAGEVKKAVAMLEKAVERKDEGMTWLIVDPKYDKLRNDQGFKALVERVGFSD